MILAKQIYLSRFLFAASSVAMPADCEIHVTEMYDSSIAINSYASDSAFSEFSWNTSKLFVRFLSNLDNIAGFLAHIISA